MRWSCTLILLLLAVLLTSCSAGRTSYAVLRGGAFVPEGGDVGPTGEIAAGYEWKIFAAELGYVYYRACTDIDEPACADVDTQSVFGTVLWNIPSAADRVHLVLGGGLGFYWYKYRPYDGGNGSYTERRWEVGPHFKLGAEFLATSRVSFLLETKAVYPTGFYIFGGRSYSRGYLSTLGVKYKF